MSALGRPKAPALLELCQGGRGTPNQLTQGSELSHIVPGRLELARFGRLGRAHRAEGLLLFGQQIVWSLGHEGDGLVPRARKRPLLGARAAHPLLGVFNLAAQRDGARCTLRCHVHARRPRSLQPRRPPLGRS
eukprot:scaffold1207_cov109-Isochrysis_galbana.AAC.3